MARESVHEGTAAGLKLYVRVIPKAGRRGLERIERDAAGDAWLKVAVTEPPDKGRANAALVKLLARILGLPKSRIRIMAGETARTKTLLLEGAAGEIARRLEQELAKAGIGTDGSGK
ncbi:MAG: DUF167 domain-containing protein [Alphaproteobacteria bacterium]|nr:MAG: DUF167 domain-containing protein [Alphaproteobacteria bacterium]